MAILKELGLSTQTLSLRSSATSLMSKTFRERDPGSAILLVISIVCAVLLFKVVHRWICLGHIPGPFWCSISNIPRLRWAWGRKAHRIHIGLHEKYGKLVRFGPNMVSVSDPAAIAQIYGFTGKFKKSDLYSVVLPMSKGRILNGLFGTQDEEIHSMLKKPIAGIYSMSNLVSFEPYVDTTMGYFCEQLDKRFAEPGATCDFGTWLQFFAFDVIGEITFSKRLGFLEKGEDVDNIMGDIWKFFLYLAPIGQMPWLDRVWAKNPIISRMRPADSNAMSAFALVRQKEREKVEKFGDAEAALNQSDFLSRFLAAKQKDPTIPDWAILAWTQSNITAGSDTTAIFLRTLFYNLLRYPETLQKIMTELIEAKENGELDELASWHQTRSLPYLDACVKEAGRIHPPVGIPLERVVPPEGATICGQFLKGGTIVGMNAWVVHRDRELFGEDADEWNPGRWFCDEEKRKAMDRGLLTFGAGNRSCIGKNISQLEVYKLVPTLLQRYEITLAHPEREWDVQNGFLTPQFDFDVRLTRREG